MHTPGPAASSVNLTELLENARIGPLQIRVFTLSMLCLIMDGFDVQESRSISPTPVQMAESATLKAGNPSSPPPRGWRWK